MNSPTDPRAASIVPPEILSRRRESVLEKLGGGVAIVPSAHELLRSRDTEIRYRQSSDFHYLTGFPEPESLAVLTPHDAQRRFTLFVRERDPEREAWSGPRLGPDAARELTGADAVYPIAELDTRLPELLEPSDCIHYPIAADPVLDDRVLAAIVASRRARQRTGVGPTRIADLDEITGPLRLVKDDHELALIRQAARISAAGHRAAMAAARPEIGEWRIEAALEAAFRAHGASGPAFPSIVGTGPNATVLHYVSNDRRARHGDLVLIDAGAEWGMYCADITRTFPVSGRFTEPQREVYDIVLAAEEAGIEAAKPGAPVTAVHDAAVTELTRGMIALGLIEADLPTALRERRYRRFYFHQTSHWLGLDVHDAGPYLTAGAPIVLQPGMVLTVEPGMYIPDAPDVPERYRGIGIRIEDDVLVTADGNEILTRDVPVDPREVETMVGHG